MNTGDTIAKPIPSPSTREYENLLGELYNAYNPNEPAREWEYRDLSQARGRAALADDVGQSLRFTDSSGYLRYLYSGHIGGGKSSEMRHLVSVLKDSSRMVGARRFFPIYIDTDDYLNASDVEMPDLLFAIAVQIGSVLKEPPFNIELAAADITELFQRAKDLIPAGLSLDKL